MEYRRWCKLHVQVKTTRCHSKFEVHEVVNCVTNLKVHLRDCAGNVNTGHSRYVNFAYLDTTTDVKVIFHSQNFFSIFTCISTPSMSKTVNRKQRVSRGDFSFPTLIFYYICYFLCRSKNGRSHGHHIVCLGYVHVLAEVQTSSKQQLKWSTFFWLSN